MVFLNRKSEPRSQAGAPVTSLADMQPAPRPAAAVHTLANGPAAAPAADDGLDETESVIGNDFSIEGQTITIRCKGSLRINGNIQANLHSRRLVVGEAARITGSIVAEEVAVHGQVEGSISGAVVRLEPSAIVDGDIQAHKLAIDSGAKFEGRSHWVQDPHEIAPQVEAPVHAGRLQDATHGSPSTMRSNGGSHDGMHNVLTPPPGRVPG